jgi:glycosyltransferase involved in cell wall biosynthesis
VTRPRFSVVIPTREGAATLPFTLQTCLDQDFDDYEIVVCDNCSSPATRAAVERFPDARIRYHRSPEPLAMSASWELAVSQARGEYVTLLGGDDGLMPYALCELDSLLARFGCRALHWRSALYTWPCVALEGDGNYLSLPTSRHVGVVDGRQRIGQVLKSLDYSTLPMLYTNSVIHRDLIATARRPTGRLFRARIPDVYAAFVFAYLAGTFVTVSVPMTVCGLSAKSSGVSIVLTDGRNPIANEFEDLNTRFGYLPHPWVPNLPLFPLMPVAESFLYAREAFFPDDETLSLDRRSLIQSCLAALWMTEANFRKQAVQTVRNTLADRPDLLDWFDGLAARTPPAERPQLRRAVTGCDGENWHMSVERFGVRDVAGAVELCAKLLGYEATRIVYDLRPRWEEMAELRGKLDTAHEAVDRLHADAADLQAQLLTMVGQLRETQERFRQAQGTLDGGWACLPYRVVRKARKLLGA